LDWNQKFPIDRWWREKYNIPFMSTEHKSSSFLDQLFEYTEAQLMEEFKIKDEEYIPNQGDFLKCEDQESKIMSAKEEFESEFKDLIDG
jgi:hypothetical protein